MECLLQMKAVVEQLMKAGKQPSAAKGTEREKAAGKSGGKAPEVARAYCKASAVQLWLPS